MNIWGYFYFLLGMLLLVLFYHQRLFDSDEVYGRRWMVHWLAKGMGLPILVWILLNSGSVPVLPPVAAPPSAPKLANAALPVTPPILPPVPPKPPGAFSRFAARAGYVARQTGPALFVISSYWAALTFGWFVLEISRRRLEHEDVGSLALAWGVFLLPFVGILLLGGGLKALGLASLVCLVPLAHFSQSDSQGPPAPTYSRAIASLKRGKYREAELAIIGELEKSETDFDGWIMLAELYALQFHDVDEARRTVLEICDDPRTTGSQVAQALNRLADWELQLRDDPEAARQVLEEIPRRLPGTHLARMAQLRMRQIPGTREELKAQREVKRIPLAPLRRLGGQMTDLAGEPLSREAARSLAEQCVEKLSADPKDCASRERFARLLTEHLDQADLGIEQIGLLAEMPDQPPAKMAEWLALMAFWHSTHRGETEAARKLWERLVREYPRSVEGFSAQRQLGLLSARSGGLKLGAEGASHGGDAEKKE